MLGEKIKNLRLEKGFSQEELAEKLSVVRQTVSKWEKGRSLPDSDMLLKIAEVFDTSVGELLDEQVVTAPVEVPVEEKTKPARRLKAWEIVLLALGSPIWLPLGVAAIAVLLALYVVLWAVIISLWASFGALVGCAVGGAAGGILLTSFGNGPSGIALIGTGLVCAGLAIFLFCGCRVATKGALLLTRRITLGIKSCFVKKERV